MHVLYYSARPVLLMNENSYAALLSPIVTRDNQRPHAAEPMVSIDHNPESRSFHIFYLRAIGFRVRPEAGCPWEAVCGARAELPAGGWILGKLSGKKSLPDPGEGVYLR